MPGGREGKVLTLLKGFSVRWKDIERGSEGELGNNEWVVEERAKKDRKMGEGEMALKKKKKG